MQTPHPDLLVKRSIWQNCREDLISFPEISLES